MAMTATTAAPDGSPATCSTRRRRPDPPGHQRARLPGPGGQGPQERPAPPHPGQPPHPEGRDYLVAPRGEAEWVRNVRAADGHLALLVGRRRDERVATELTDAEKVPSCGPT